MTENEALYRSLAKNPDVRDLLRTMVRAGKIVGVASASEFADEELLVICGLDHGGIDGAKQCRCSCGAIVWMTPTTQRTLAGRTAPIVLLCPPCGFKAMLATKEGSDA